MLEKIELKNFTGCENLEITFSAKINVIIGENGTGKTHLLKAAYALCAGAPLFKKKPDIDDDELAAALTTKLLRLFMPMDEKLGKLHHQGATEQAFLSAHFSQGQKIAATFSNNSKRLAIQSRANYEKFQAGAVFIPTKEVLSFMKGFNSLYEKYELSFDQSYQDVCLLLDLPEIRPENLHAKSKWAIEQIEEVCGGRFIFYGGGKVTFKTEHTEYSANAMAEGFRKAGMLARLLETGAIQPGISGPLFWDEPETNMNPKLMKLLVEILLELSRNGQQIILATHDYVLLKWFDLLTNKGSDDHVRFHSLYRDNGDIKVEIVDSFSLVNRNVISDTFAELYDEDVNRALG